MFLSDESLDLRYTCPSHPIMLYWHLKWVTNVTCHHEQRADMGNGQQKTVFSLVPARCCDTSPYLNLPLCISRWWSLINKIVLHLHPLVLSRQTAQYLCLLNRNHYCKMKYQVPWKFNTPPNTNTIWHENCRQYFKCICCAEHITISIKCVLGVQLTISQHWFR